MTTEQPQPTNEAAGGASDVERVVGRISDTDRLDYLECHDVATEFHDEFGAVFCVSRDDGLWEKHATLREAVDAAIEVNELVSQERASDERKKMYDRPTPDMLIDAGVSPNATEFSGQPLAAGPLE